MKNEKVLTGIEKLEAVKTVLVAMGFAKQFESMTVAEAFSMFNSVYTDIQSEFKINALNFPSRAI